MKGDCVATDTHLAYSDGEPDRSGPEEIAFDVVFASYAPDCYRFALRIVRDRDLAHDVVQDVFEVLVRHPDRFEPDRGQLLTWLMTLTHNKAVDLVRWRQRHARLDVSDRHLELIDAAPTPADVAWLAVERDYVMAALRRLNADEREVLVLTHFGGYTQVEIARQTGVPLGTVKSRARLGMRRMRGWLEGDLRSA